MADEYFGRAVEALGGSDISGHDIVGDWGRGYTGGGIGLHPLYPESAFRLPLEARREVFEP